MFVIEKLEDTSRRKRKHTHRSTYSAIYTKMLQCYFPNPSLFARMNVHKWDQCLSCLIIDLFYLSLYHQHRSM